MDMVRFNDTFLFTAGLAFFIGGFFTGSLVSYFLFGGLSWFVNQAPY
jgi:hypothetical protein